MTKLANKENNADLDVLKEAIPLPDDLKIYIHQIGGHGLVLNKQKVLQGPNKTVYKAVQAFPKGLHEVNFYRLVFATMKEPILHGVQSYIPEYKGLYVDQTKKVYYIGMEDVLSEIKEPSVIDVKIGRVTHTPNASSAKIAIEKAKYKYREEVGFLITGCKVFDPCSKETTSIDRFDARSFNAEDVYVKGISFFLGTNPLRARQIAKAFVDKLNDLRSWLTSQNVYSFYSSSLLLAYDSDAFSESLSTNILGNGECFNNGGGPIRDEAITVRWVDFTHWLDSNHDVDHNFLYGLDKLIAYFQRRIDDLSTFNHYCDDASNLDSC